MRLNTPPAAGPDRPGGPTGEPGGLRGLPVAEGRPALRQVYQRAWFAHPGWSSRDERWWDYLLADLDAHRRGVTTTRLTLHEGQSGVDGYALWRVKPDWAPSGSRNVVQVKEVF